MNKREALLRHGPFRQCQARVPARSEAGRLGPARGPIGVPRSVCLLPGCLPWGGFSLSFLPFVLTPGMRAEFRKVCWRLPEEAAHPTCLLWRATLVLTLSLCPFTCCCLCDCHLSFFPFPFRAARGQRSFLSDLKAAHASTAKVTAGTLTTAGTREHRAAPHLCTPEPPSLLPLVVITLLCSPVSGYVSCMAGFVLLSAFVKVTRSMQAYISLSVTLPMSLDHIGEQQHLF